MTLSRRRLLGGLVGGAIGGVGMLGCASSSNDRTATRPTAAAPPPGSPPATTTPPATATTTTATTSTAPITTTPVVERTAYFPSTTWETLTPEQVGWDRARLDEAMTFVASRSTTAVVLLHGGRILAEQFIGVDPTYRRDVASCQKSVVALLLGIAQDRRLLAIDDPVTAVLGAGWTNAAADDERAITIRHLLTMTSGLDAERRAVARPGTVWSYNNDAYHQLQPILEIVTGAGIDALCAEWLWAPIGVTGSSWDQRRGGGRYAADARGAPMWGLTMSARDMARVGLLVQREGRWDGRAVLGDGSYLAAALSPSSEMNPSYGYLWWLNGQPGHRVGPGGDLQAGPLIPDGPPDLVAALGKDDQKIYVSRAEDIVLVRQGGRAGTRSSESLSDFDRELWRLVLAASGSGG